MAVDFCLSNSLDVNSSMTWLVQYLVTLLVCMTVCVWGCLLRILPEICFWVRKQLLFVSSCFSIGSTLDLVLYLIEELGLKLLFWQESQPSWQVHNVLETHSSYTWCNLSIIFWKNQNILGSIYFFPLEEKQWPYIVRKWVADTDFYPPHLTS